MSDSKTSFSHNSVWGANWLIAVESAPPKDFNDDEVRQALEENFGATPNAYADVLDYVREGCRMEFGSKDESIATLIVGELQALGLKARLVPGLVEPHRKFPAWHSPTGAFLDPPLLVRVSGGSGAQDLERSASLISHISVMIPKTAVKEALAQCRGKFYADFPAFYREHAESLSECLVELGWTVTVVQSTERLMGS